MLFGNPVDGPRIVAFQQERESADKLPNGRPGFRVTQPFGVPDSYYGGKAKHSGVDVGNFYCGDRVLAMASGKVALIDDNAKAVGAKSDALGIRITHPSGWSTEYWHLNAYARGLVTNALVKKGQYIGVVGRTGLGDVCHLHLEAKLNGRQVDLWPLLEQNAMFSDVKKGSTHAADIEWAAEARLLRGISATEFGPNGPLTRAQAATLTRRLVAFLDRRYQEK